MSDESEALRAAASKVPGQRFCVGNDVFAVGANREPVRLCGADIVALLADAQALKRENEKLWSVARIAIVLVQLRKTDQSDDWLEQELKAENELEKALLALDPEALQKPDPRDVVVEAARKVARPGTLPACLTEQARYHTNAMMSLDAALSELDDEEERELADDPIAREADAAIERAERRMKGGA